ncbi:sigma-54-dependent Fis family transcriptional regulator [Desulfofundulus sp.]|uniref:sigma-54-dependent Fis family transcriptional regulator n=1 Tax=Desulfofundulus sp. TaxID=2282750 RepID=UPI003C739D74
MTPDAKVTFFEGNGKGNFQLIWRHFVEKGVLIEPGVRPVIARSWQRSTRIDPFSNQRIVLPKQRLDWRRRQYQDLISLARPVMQEILSLDEKCYVLLSDSEGYIIEKVSKVECPIPLGAKCREEDIGTNAIGTALIERGPVEIKGYEHYVPRLHSYHCAAVPIYDAKGNIIGVMDVTRPEGDLPAGILQLLKFAGKLIEYQLNFRQKCCCSGKIASTLGTLVDLIDKCTVIVDSGGRIVYANKKLCDFLEIDNQQKIMGLHYLDLLKSSDNMDKQTTFSVHNFPAGYNRGLAKEIAGKVIGKRQIGNCQEASTLVLLDFKNNASLSSPSRSVYRFHEITGKAKCWSEIIWRAKKAAQVSSNVLIEGESGTGKELIARAIHDESGRKGPFVPINCGAIPKDLIESELFGYEDGAFTGAKKGGKMGKFEIAEGGTLFLDEIGEMALEMQVHLLRVLQEKKVTRLGGTNARSVDVRIIAATNRDLRKEVEAGRFRQDLYFRLNVINIKLPPLRERKEDIPILVEYFFLKFCQQFQKNITSVDKEVMEILCNYDWPGNVRELSNVIENAVVFTEGDVILPEVIPPYIKEYEPVRDLTGGSLREVEEKLILETLKIHNGNISKAAKALGVTRNTIYRKIKSAKLDMD